MTFLLKPHPGTISSALTAIEVSAHRGTDSRVTLTAHLLGDRNGVVLPPRTDPGRADGLWARTCLELFVAASDGGYYEFNFSPSGQWAAYRFTGYREGMAEVTPEAITGFGYRVEPGIIGGHVQIDLAGLEGIDFDAPLRVGLSAVIEEADGRRTYWALAHPAGKPDFHDPVAFAGEIAKVIYW
ncbi:DOMON-like domain-containing protein [Brevundimonas sp.]|uniref:DOMON-like domain-containing protein n=1 Tax=Brevundimonas sp. TaxID=1871086 RepID=UPI002ED9C38B